MMQFRLVISAGKDAGLARSFDLDDEGQIVIGRGDECDLSVWDESVSRRHAIVERHGDEIRLIDLGSSNGTLVHGRPVKRCRLEDGERIKIGATEIRFERGGFQRRPTAVLKRQDLYKIENSLTRDAVDLGARIAPDATRRDRLNMLLELVDEVQSEEGGEAILRALLRRAVDALAPAHAAVIPCSSRSREPLWRETLRHPAGSDDGALSRSVIERVLDEGNALRIADAHSDPRTRARESIAQREVGSILAVPVAARERIHGVLYLEGSAGRYDEGDLAYAATLGQVTGMALQNAERLQQSRRLLDAREPSTGAEIITESREMRQAMEHVAQFAASGGPVLIVGETGTGKELLARLAHRKGLHASGQWVPVNCAAIPAALLESELFGHEKGAFTGATGRKAGMFELADRGTLFLDEIGDLPLELQPKLLRVLETGEFFRIGGRSAVSVQLLVVSATHRDLARRVTEGTFREDLYYRLSRFQVRVPPLRERPADVELLARRFLDDARRRSAAPLLEISEAALVELRSYPWPGNVRELRNVIERAAVLAAGDRLEAGDLGLATAGSTAPPAMQASASGPPPSLEEVEEAAIRRVLRHTKGVKGEAAQLLGISWPTLRRKLRKYRIDAERP